MGGLCNRERKGGGLSRRMVACFALLLGCVACAGEPAQGVAAPPGPKTVLVAGDDQLPVFNDAIAGMRNRLLSSGAVGSGDIQLVSALPDGIAAGGVHLATLDNVLETIAAMRPRAGQGCLVFATSHGGKHQGLWLAASQQFLTPRMLDLALQRGCGTAPTVVVVSACFSGIFAQPPMARANRVVLTAARPDRTSFGCGAGREFTVYDACLLGALDAGGTWKGAYYFVRRCVASEEQREGARPSEPQAWFGAEVADKALPIGALPQ